MRIYHIEIVFPCSLLRISKFMTGNYSDIECPASVCSFGNEPWTPYYWDDFCQWGMLGLPLEPKTLNP